ncbi:MAG: S-layer homology domain-containing protein, partial [Eubacteriales bacterium]
MKKGMTRILSRIMIVAILVSMVTDFNVSGKTWALVENAYKSTSAQGTKLSLEKAPEIDSSASAWAVPQIQQAYEYGLTYPDIMTDFKKPITREEFCTIVVKLYGKLTNQTVTAGSSPFTDTTNPEIIKAYQLEIVKGTGAGKFSPDLNITRQEICVMIFRTLEKGVPKLNKNTDDDFPFNDKKTIASWALNAMKFAYKNSIMAGVGGNKIAPLSNTTREQAITLVKRTYEAFRPNENKATILIGQPDPVVLPEKEKFIKLDFNNRLVSPKYDTRIELFAATEAGRPAKRDVRTMAIGRTVPKPLTPSIINPSIQPNLSTPIPPQWLLPRPVGPVYSKASYAAFIDQNGDKKRWFAFSLNNAQTNKVAWQVSKTPFTGFKDNWKKPPGLVASGEVSAQAGEFVIDFASFTPSQLLNLLKLNTIGQFIWNNTNSYKEIPKSQRKYYVRAVPIDKSGNCIGDPGEGIAVLYGKPLAAPSTTVKSLDTSFELWAPAQEGYTEGGGPENKGYSGEFPNKMVHSDSARYYTCGSPSPYWFLFNGFDASASKVVMQVSAKPFSGDAANWEAPQGLVYIKSYDKLPVTVNSIFKNAVPIVFSDFGPAKTSMKPDEYVPYYVRAVALKPSSTPGSVDVTFSEVITVNYGYPKAPKIFSFENVSVKSYTPSVKVLNYNPIQWENPEWTHNYMVFRAPEWNEINCNYKNVQTGDMLYPYSFYILTDNTITTAKYKNEIIPRVLVPGTKVTIIDREEDKSWWEELWDDIVSFFSSVFEIIKKLTNWVSSAYTSLKQGLINFVANNFPGIPDSWRAGLKLALEALVNSGLAALGIPPSLPNFDQLSNMSLDYLAEVALTEAGIPANEITKELVSQTAKGLGNEMAKATASATPNPINAPFLKANPDYLYRPAYIEVELSNGYDKPSIPGSLNIDAEWEWKDTITLNHETWAQLPTNEQYADALKYFLHFVYGL